MKTIKQALKSANDGKNQDIKSKFVAQHVFANVNSLVEYCLKNEDPNSPINFDMIENYWFYPEFNGHFVKFDGGSEDKKQEEIERAESLLELGDAEFTAEDQALIQDELQCLKDLESEPSEIFEWWLISDYLFDKLRDKGYPIIDFSNGYLWGRTTTGQAILLDGIISHICAEMGILEGQENAWL